MEVEAPETHAAPAWKAWVGWTAAVLMAFLWLVAVSVPAGLLLQIPGRIDASRWSDEALERARPPVPREPGGGEELRKAGDPGSTPRGRL